MLSHQVLETGGGPTTQGPRRSPRVVERQKTWMREVLRPRPVNGVSTGQCRVTSSGLASLKNFGGLWATGVVSGTWPRDGQDRENLPAGYTGRTDREGAALRWLVCIFEGKLGLSAVSKHWLCQGGQLLPSQEDLFKLSRYHNT